jgi:hypothetical protein
MKNLSKKNLALQQVLLAIKNNDSEKVTDYCKSKPHQQAMVLHQKDIEGKIQEKSKSIEQQQKEILQKRVNIKTKITQKFKEDIEKIKEPNPQKRKELISKAKEKSKEVFKKESREIRNQSQTLKLAAHTNRAINLMVQSAITIEKLQSRTTNSANVSLGSKIKSFLSNIANTIKKVFSPQKATATTTLPQPLKDSGTFQSQSSSKAQSQNQSQQSQKANNKVLKQAQQQLLSTPHSLLTKSTSIQPPSNTSHKQENTSNRGR